MSKQNQTVEVQFTLCYNPELPEETGHGLRRTHWLSGRTGSVDKRPADCPVHSGITHRCTSNSDPTPKPNGNLTAIATLTKIEYWD